MFCTDIVDCKIVIRRNIHIADKYKQLFHGYTDITKGTYFYHYKMSSFVNSRLVNRFSSFYNIPVEYTFAKTSEKDIDEVS